VQRADVSILTATSKRRFEIDEEAQPSFFANRGFALVHCHPESMLSLRPGLASLWSPICGDALFAAGESDAILTRRSVYASDSQRRLTIALGSSSRCIGVVASQAAWSRLIEPWQTPASQEYAVFPAVHAANHGVRRRILRFLREVRSNETQDRYGALPLLASILNELQLGFEPCIERCPGHSMAKRRAVFARLQRARNYIALSPTEDFHVGRLALIANYSIWRFIKVFCRVFGETPHAYVSRSRAEYARQLLRNSDLAVGDVGIASGFDSRASFSRVIKRHLGQPASAIRRAARIGIAV